MLEYRHQCTCGLASASEYARVNHAADHAGVQWTVSAMQRVVKGHAYVRVCVPDKTRTAAVASGGPAAEAAVAATVAVVAAAMTDGREARLQAVLTTPVNCHDEMSTDVGAGDHTVQTFQRQMGWHMPLDRRMTPDLAEALVGNGESDVERRVDAVVERWMARLCTTISALPADDRRVLSQIRSFTGEEEDGPPLRALERRSQPAYTATLAGFLRFLYRASRARVRTQLAAESEGTPAAAAAAVTGNVRRPAIDVPAPVRAAVDALYDNPSDAAVGDCVDGVFGDDELAGRATATGAVMAGRLVRVAAEVQLISWFFRLRAVRRDHRLARPDDVGHWAVHLIYAARLAVASKVADYVGLTQTQLQDALATVTYPNAPSPFDTLVSVRREARAAASGDVGRATISDVPGSEYRAVRVLGVTRTISLDDLGDMCMRLQTSVRARLAVLTAGVPLLRLSDLCGVGETPDQLEFGETTAGRAVIPDRSGPVADAIAAAAWRRGGGTLLPFGPMVTASGALDARGVNTYLREASRVVDELLTLVHVSSGQPARGSELAALLWRNTATAERNVYVRHGTLLLLQRYAKSRNIVNADQYVGRYLDADTADLLASYLAQVRPVETRLLVAQAADVDTDDARSRVVVSHTVLFGHAGRPLVDDAVGAIFRATMASTVVGLGEPLGLLQFRHVVVHFARLHLKADDRLLELMEAVDHQAVHSSQVGMAVYGRVHGQRGRTEDDRHHLQLSASWQRLLGLRPVRGALDRPSSSPVAATAAGSADLPASKRRRRLSRGALAASASPPPSPTLSTAAVVPDLRLVVVDAVRDTLAVQLRAALAQSGFLVPPPTTAAASNTTVSTSPPPLRMASTPHEISATAVVWSAGESELVYGVLCALHGADRVRAPLPELAVALRAVLYAPQRSLLVVLPTGSGKTALLVADALAERAASTVVVVVTPLRALATQTQRLCERIGVACSTLGAHTVGGLAADTRVLLVAAELVGTDTYRHVLGSLRDASRLRRVIVDEAHLFASDGVVLDGFRPKLLRALRAVRGGLPDVSVLLMSATVPPSLARTLMTEAELPQLDVVRAPSARTNVRLSVVTVPASDALSVEACAAAMAAAYAARCERRDRVVVLVLTVDAVERVAAAIGRRQPGRNVHRYHASLEREEQAAGAAAWAADNGAGAVMVATSGFGTGVDYPSVRAVVHVSGAYGVLELVQELGRAGRDLAPALHVLVVPASSAASASVPAAAAAAAATDPSTINAETGVGSVRGTATIAAYAATFECRGQFLARHVDGVAGLPCRLAGRLPCDRCAPTLLACDTDRAAFFAAPVRGGMSGGRYSVCGVAPRY
jgi:hypothetical protein